MTLAVAAVCPWGLVIRPDIRYGLEYGVEVLECVIVASDSRWSGGQRPLLDVGRKLYVIGKSAAAVFAGDVRAGHDGIKRLQRQYHRTRVQNFNDVATLAQETFAFSYRRERNERSELCGPLYYLLAMGNPTEGVRLIYCGYENNFRPEVRTGIQLLGDEQAKRAFLETFNRGIASWREEGKALIEYSSWEIAVAASLDAAVERVRGTVGGKVQLGVVNREGYHSSQIVSLDKVADPPEEDVWRTITSQGLLVERPIDDQR